MTVRQRSYSGLDDYWGVSAFLIRHHLPDNADGNWLEPAWEYMHGHPALDAESLERIGIWEDEDEIVAVANYESTLGEAFFQFHPAYRHVREAMLAYAEERLARQADDGRYTLSVYVNDDDRPFRELVKARGYASDPRNNRPMSRYVVSEPFRLRPLPEGYRLTNLAEECDWGRVHRVLWRGFNHAGDPPPGEEELESRRRMFETATARHELKIAVAGPDGAFVAFCGTFYEPTGRYCYVEPVATDPDHRRLGLGRAAVLEGIRRCADLGATVAYVGSDQPFYRAIGFRVLYSAECWTRRW